MLALSFLANISNDRIQHAKAFVQCKRTLNIMRVLDLLGAMVGCYAMILIDNKGTRCKNGISVSGIVCDAINVHFS